MSATLESKVKRKRLVKYPGLLTPVDGSEAVIPESLGDIMLSSRSRLYAGAAGSCPGCGESSAIRMLLSATGFFYAGDHIGVVVALGCCQAAGSTYRYTPYEVA